MSRFSADDLHDNRAVDVGEHVLLEVLLIHGGDDRSVLDAHHEGGIVDQNERFLGSLRGGLFDPVQDPIPLGLAQFDVSTLEPGLGVAADFQAILEDRGEVGAAFDLARLNRLGRWLSDQEIVDSAVLNSTVHFVTL